MRRSVRLGLIAASVPLVLGALIVGGLLLAGNTQWGRARIEWLVGHLTANNVRLTGLGGALPDRLTLQQLQLADTRGIWLTAQNVDLTWHAWSLLHGQIAVQSVSAQRVDFARLPLSQSHGGGNSSIPDIDVHELSVETVNLGAALAGAPATLNLHGSAHLRSLQDMQFTVAATRLDAQGTYSAQLAFDAKRMDAVFRVREPAHGPLAGLLGVPAIGPIQVSGDLAGLRQAEHAAVQLDLGDLHAHATGTVNLVAGSAELEYAADATAMAPRADLSWQHLHARGTWHGTLAAAVAAGELQALGVALPGQMRVGALNASLEARAGTLSVRGTLAAATAPGVPPDLLGRAPLTVNGTIQFGKPSHPFEVRASHPTITLVAKGEATGTPVIDADVEVPDVTPLLRTPAGLSGPLHLHAHAQREGSRIPLRVTATGNLDSTQASLHGWLRGPQSADIRATYEPTSFTMAESVLSNKAVKLTLAGRLSAAAQNAPWTVKGKTRVTLADLAVVLPSLSGQADVQADLSGNLASLRVAGNLRADVAMSGSAPGTVQGTFDASGLPGAPHAQLRLSGPLAGQPLNLQADVLVRPGEAIHISLPQASWQSLRAQGDLTLAQDVDRSQGQLQWSIGKLADFSQILGQHLGGQITGSVSLTPAGTGSAANGAASTNLKVSGEDLEFGTQKLSASLTGTGPLHDLQLALDAQSTLLNAPATLKAQGHLEGAQRRLTLAAMNATVHGLDLTLRQAATIDFSQGVAVSGLLVGAADAQLQASGQILPQLQLQAQLTDDTPGLVNALLPGFLASGKFKGTLQLQGSLAHPLGQVRLSGTDLRAAGDAASLPPAQLLASADLAVEGAQISLQSSAGDTSHMKIAGSIPWSGPISVDATGNLDLSRLNPLMESAGRRISGTVDVNAQVAGTFDTPNVNGSVQLHKGAVHDYRHGIDLTQIEGTLEGTQRELRITGLTAHAASGTISVAGTVGVLQGGWPVNLKLTAREAQPFSSSVVTGSVNADLALTGTALHELTLAGKINVNRATVEIPNSFPPNVAVLEVRRPGQVVDATTGSGPVFNLNVTINAPRQILVRGRGLDAELGGTVQIGGTARLPTANGGFDLQRGLFTLAGSRLNFSSGRVSFTGADVTGKIDPTLDFTAQTTALDAMVTLRITGVADAPQFELTSVPQLPQDEILARLLFGESAGQLTAIQAAQIGAALVTLTGAGGGINPLVELQKHLGLDRLSVGSNDTGTPGSAQNSGATIEAGRYVTNRIFVDVKQNTTGSTQLQVDVDLTNKLKLQTRVGTGTATVQGTTPDNDPGSSVGLSYRFEY